jgi:hypothetical protein
MKKMQKSEAGKINPVQEDKGFLNERASRETQEERDKRYDEQRERDRKWNEGVTEREKQWQQEVRERELKREQEERR